MRKSLTTRLAKKHKKPKGLESTSLVLAYVEVRNRKGNIMHRRNWIREPNHILGLYRHGYEVLDWGVIKKGNYYSQKPRNR